LKIVGGAALFRIVSIFCELSPNPWGFQPEAVSILAAHPVTTSRFSGNSTTVRARRGDNPRARFLP
jgi:hypothetical protein